MKRNQLEIRGQTRKAREESFDATREDWNTYVLESGTEVRVKITVLKIFRLLDDEGRPVYSEDGDPDVVARHQVQVVTSRGPEPIADKEVH